MTGPEIKKPCRFMGSPYLFFLTLLGSVAGMGCAYAMCAIVISEKTIRGVMDDPWSIALFALILLLVLGLLFACYLERFECFSIVEIKEDRLIFRGFFCRRDFYYRDMHDIGVDYGLIDGMKQFWLYFSREPLPMKYFHRINRVKFTKECMRVQYRKKSYELLIRETPPEISKRLRNCYSTVRLYKLDKDE